MNISKSTRYIDKAGYVVVKLPDHPNATTNGWVREHVVVASKTLGRPIKRSENVHHKDENKQNNDPLNLIVTRRGLHTRLHFGNPRNRQDGENNPLIPCACGCGKTLRKFDNRGRPRGSLRGHLGNRGYEN